MARSEILLGTPPSGVGGDTPRSANIKINAMTTEIYTKLDGLGTAATAPAQTLRKAASGQLLRADLNGVGMMSTLEGTIYQTGVPSDLFGTGFCQGFCSGGVLGIPGMIGVNYGVLTSKMHWSDTSGGGGNMQEWTAGAIRYTRIPANAGAWAAWQLAGAQTVGPMGTGLLQSIVERGSNANGEYVRFIDGTQICWLAVTGYTANVSKIGIFPMAFLAAATTTVTCSVTPVGAYDWSHAIYPSGINEWTFASTTSSSSNIIKIMAVGRWK